MCFLTIGKAKGKGREANRKDLGGWQLIAKKEKQGRRTETPWQIIGMVLEKQWGESIDEIRIFLKHLDTIPSSIGTLDITCCWISCRSALDYELL